MEPPPLTILKKRDPLRDGAVFGATRQDSPGALSQQQQQQQLVRSGGPQAGPSAGAFSSTTLLRSAAEAAALNRSREALHIKRDWDALVGASPLPQAVRQVLSPAPAQPWLGRLPGGYASPAASLPYLRDPFQLPPLPTQQRPAAASFLPYGMGPGPLSAAPRHEAAGLYRSSLQQQQQQQDRHRHHQQQQAQAGGGLEVEASKFTRVVHSHSPGYQAVVSSTVEVVRTQQQAAVQLQPQPRLQGPPRPHPGVTVRELPPERGAAAEQQAQRPLQQEQHAQQQALVLPARAGDGPQAVPQQAARPSAAPGVCQQGTAPALRSEGPEATSPSGGSAVLQPLCSQQPSPPGGSPAGGGPVPGSAFLRPPRPSSEPDSGDGTYGGGADSSMQQAMAVVGALVQDFSTPGEAALPSGSPEQQQEQRQVKSRMYERGTADARDAEREAGSEALEAGGSAGPAVPGGAAGQQELRGSLGSPPGLASGLPAAQRPTPPGSGEVLEKQRWWDQFSRPPRHRRVSAAGRTPHQAQQQQAREEREAQPDSTGTPAAIAAAASGAEAAGAGIAVAIATASPRGSSPTEQAELAASLVHVAPAPAEQQQQQQQQQREPEQQQQPGKGARRAKSEGSKGGKKRARVEGAAEVAKAAKRRTMPARADGATVQPILRSIGDDTSGVEVTRSGRPRIKPLPYWSNSRVVLSKDRDAVAIEHRADLLGSWGQPQAQPRAPAAGARAVNLEPAAAAATKPGKVKAKAAAADQLPGSAAAAGAAAVSKAGRASGKGQPQSAAAAAEAGQPAPAAAQREGGQPRLQPQRAGAEEMEAAVQLQQLGQGQEPASPARARAPPRTSSLPKHPPAGAACRAALPAPGSAPGLAALAVTAGVEAARSVGREEGPAQSGPELPTLPGVPAEVVHSLSQVPARQRRKCGHCKHCHAPASKQACLVLQALRALEASSATVQQQRQQGGGPSTQHSKPQDASGSQPPPKRVAKQPAQQQAAGVGAKAGGGSAQMKEVVKGAGGDTAQGAPPAKIARAQCARDERQQQQQAEQREEQDAGEARGAGPLRAGDATAGPAAQAAPEARTGSPAEEEEEDEQGWTASQSAALQRTWLRLDPTASNFWQLVAKQVPGKTASECYKRYMARHPTPPHAGRKPAPKKYLAAAQGGARLPELRPGASKQVVQNAARKYARQLQWQQKASKAQAEGGGSLGEELVEEMEAAERKDRYIDQILRKRQGRPLGAAARGRKAPPPAAAGAAASRLPPPQLGGSGGGVLLGQAGTGHKLRVAESEREVRAALAGLGVTADEEDKDSDDDSDYYWSDD